MPQMEGSTDQIAAGWFAKEPASERPVGLPRTGSSSRLNAQAPEFVPRGPPPPAPAVVLPPPPQVIRMFAAPPPPPRGGFFAAPQPRPFEYYAPIGERSGFAAKEQQAPELEAEMLPPAAVKTEPVVDGLDDEVVHKITKQVMERYKEQKDLYMVFIDLEKAYDKILRNLMWQALDKYKVPTKYVKFIKDMYDKVEYYFSDINLATTEHLMRFITKDSEGFVPISVIAGFKKVKTSVRNNVMLAAALRTSSKLVVSDDGKRVKRQQPFTESDLQELQTPNGTGPATNRSSKLDMLFANKLHAFVEYETPEDAAKAILELNDEKNWRNGLRVRLLNTCTVKGAGKGKNGMNETDGNSEEDVSTLNHSNEKQFEQSSQLLDVLPEHLFDENFNKEVPKRGKGRGRGGRGHGRGNHQYNNHHHNNQHHQNNQPQYNNHGNNHLGGNRGSLHSVGTTPHNLKTKLEPHPQLPIGANKLPPGPRMPDGTRGFTRGRGKPQAVLPGLCAVGVE
ncbi:La-related protein 6B [Zea mays]|uniref:La-related protein 6B n=1 Tax=Zea mays TaxID=4577 RepID=A0A3L6G5I8_MAIZE|nr:La-related protein 6B [Zea mays]